MCPLSFHWSQLISHLAARDAGREPLAKWAGEKGNGFDE